ncbi:MAG: G5 domain-containing protein [Armatimonadetes bacterium]|nr:G5 domain-containing protein [Armatimonadota bacterium]
MTQDADYGTKRTLDGTRAVYLPNQSPSAALDLSTPHWHNSWTMRVRARLRNMRPSAHAAIGVGKYIVRLTILLTTVLVLCVGGSLAAVSRTDIGREATLLPRVMVSVDGSVIGLSTSAESVGDLLEDLSIELGPLDRATPGPDTLVTDELTIEVTRVSCREVIAEETMSPLTVVLADPDKPAGYTKMLSEGQDGMVRRTYRVWEKNGEESSRGIIAEEVLVPAQDIVVLRGTRGLTSRGGNWRNPVLMEATAYDPGPKSCGKWASGYTATGAKAEKGIVAVDDRVIPMGTKMYIPGYGFGVAADRGGAIKGMRIDLCYPTYEEAIQWGRKHVKVYLLD